MRCREPQYEGTTERGHLGRFGDLMEAESKRAQWSDRPVSLLEPAHDKLGLARATHAARDLYLHRAGDRVTF